MLFYFTTITANSQVVAVGARSDLESAESFVLRWLYNQWEEEPYNLKKYWENVSFSTFYEDKSPKEILDSFFMRSARFFYEIHPVDVLVQRGKEEGVVDLSEKECRIIIKALKSMELNPLMEIVGTSSSGEACKELTGLINKLSD